MIPGVQFGHTASQPLQFAGGCASQKQPAFKGSFADLKTFATEKVNAGIVSSREKLAGLGQRLNVLA